MSWTSTVFRRKVKRKAANKCLASVLADLKATKIEKCSGISPGLAKKRQHERWIGPYVVAVRYHISDLNVAVWL